MATYNNSRDYWAAKDAKIQPADFVARENFKAKLARRVTLALEEAAANAQQEAARKKATPTLTPTLTPEEAATEAKLAAWVRSEFGSKAPSTE